MSSPRRKPLCGAENLAVAGRLFTIQEVAENWRVSTRTIRRMILSGALPAVRLGRAVRIRENLVIRLKPAK